MPGKGFLQLRRAVRVPQVPRNGPRELLRLQLPAQHAAGLNEEEGGLKPVFAVIRRVLGMFLFQGVNHFRVLAHIGFVLVAAKPEPVSRPGRGVRWMVRGFGLERLQTGGDHSRHHSGTTVNPRHCLAFCCDDLSELQRLQSLDVRLGHLVQCLGRVQRQVQHEVGRSFQALPWHPFAVLRVQ
ncbi:hypothetical protein D3C73_1057380 [compost metagenome]